MNKKAVAILLISAVGFLIASVAFYAYGFKSIPGGEQTRYLGSNGMNVFDVYHKSDSMMVYIDMAAEMALDKAKEEKSEEAVLRVFSSEFGSYLDTFNLEYGTDLKVIDYSLTLDNTGIKGVCNKQLTIKQDNIKYSFRPNFRVSESLEFSEP